MENGESTTGTGTGTGQQTQQGQMPAEKLLTQAHANALLAEQKRELEARFAPSVEAAAKLAKLEEQNKSETEKLIESARKEEREKLTKEHEGTLLRMKINTALADDLRARGYNPALMGASILQTKVPTSVESVAASVETFLTENGLPAKLEPGKTLAPGYPGGPAPANQANAKFKRSQLQDRAFYEAHKAEIMVAQSRGEIEEG